MAGTPAGGRASYAELARTVSYQELSQRGGSPQRLSREGRLELAFLQATIYVALSLNNEAILEDIAGEIRDGVLAHQRAANEVTLSAMLVQRNWKAHHEGKGERRGDSLYKLTRQMPPGQRKDPTRVLPRWYGGD